MLDLEQWRESVAGTNLLVDDSAETGLALDDGVRDTHLAAESGKEDDQLNWINVVGDQDKRSLLVLDQANDVVETILDGVRLLGDILLLLALRNGSGLLGETLLLLGLGLRTVLVEELEGLSSGVAVEDVLELGDRRGNLQAKVENLLLALKTDILGPLHHARQVALGLDVLTDAIVAGALLEEGVLHALVSIRGEESMDWSQLTLACFLEPALPDEKGAGAVFFPDLGGYH